MSNLVLELKPGETMLINGVMIRFRTRTRLELLSRARFLFGKQFMSDAEARTPATRLYHALQMAYAGNEDDRDAAIAVAIALLDAQEASASSDADRTLIGAVRPAIAYGENYAAVKFARDLVASEALGTPQ